METHQNKNYIQYIYFGGETSPDIPGILNSDGGTLGRFPDLRWKVAILDSVPRSRAEVASLYCDPNIDSVFYDKSNGFYFHVRR